MGLDGDDESLLFEENVSATRARIIQLQSSNKGHMTEGSVAMPGLMRPGGNGKSTFIYSPLSHRNVHINQWLKYLKISL